MDDNTQINTIIKEENVAVNEVTEIPKKSKRGLVLCILAFLIILVGSLLTYIYLNKKEKVVGKYFSKTTYFYGKSSSDADGVMPEYMVLTKDGKYVSILVSPNPNGEAGTYEIDNDEITFTRQYFYTTLNGLEVEDPTTNSVGHVNKGIYKNDKIEIFSYTFSQVSKTKFDESNNTYYSYEDIVKKYKESSNVVKEEIKELNEYCNSDLKEGTVVTDNQTYTVSYEIADYYEEAISSINVIIKNEAGKEVLKGECYNLSNEELLDYAINTDGTITALYSDGSDDSVNFQVVTFDTKGNKKSTKKLSCQNGRPVVVKDQETVCSEN